MFPLPRHPRLELRLTPTFNRPTPMQNNLARLRSARRAYRIAMEVAQDHALAQEIRELISELIAAGGTHTTR
jgi:hypothetical protein